MGKNKLMHSNLQEVDLQKYLEQNSEQKQVMICAMPQ